MEENIQVNKTNVGNIPPIDQKTINEHNDKALTSFIVGVASLLLNVALYFPVAGLVCAIISLGLSKSSEHANKRPHKVFRRIALPLSIANIVLAAILIFVSVIAFILLILRALYEKGFIDFMIPQLPFLPDDSSFSSIGSSILSSLI